MRALRNAEAPASARSEADTDYPTSEADSQERFRLFRLCPCEMCNGTGKALVRIEFDSGHHTSDMVRCRDCRGEGKVRQLVATCATPQDVGVALVTLGREGEWADCPFGLLDTEGEPGQKWLVLPWLASPRNISDAGRTLRQAQTKGER